MLTLPYVFPRNVGMVAISTRTAMEIGPLSFRVRSVAVTHYFVVGLNLYYYVRLSIVYTKSFKFH